MKELLKNYIEKKLGYTNVKIEWHDVDGSICHVEYYPCADEIYAEYKQHININIWDMLAFLMSPDKTIKK